MEPVILFSVIAICITIARIKRIKYENQDQIIHYHCPSCQKYYPSSEFDGDKPTARLKP